MGQSGRNSALLAEKEALQRKVTQYDLASMYADMGELTRARAAMIAAIDGREAGIVWMRVDPRMDGLRRDPELREVFQRLAWRAGRKTL